MKVRALFGTSLLLMASHAFAQQDYVARFDAYGGFAYLNSPQLNLNERGFQFQAGYRPKTWYTLGFDYSVSTGRGELTQNLLTTALQTQLTAQLTPLATLGLIPAGYSVTLPFNSTTEEFAAGPQLSYRHWSLVTLFIRPSIGAVYESVTPHAGDPIAAALVTQLAPSGQKTDWHPFYGFGGGFDLNVSKRVALRFQGDFVHDHLFSDILKNGRNTVRFGVGPAFQFGHNIAK